MSGAVADALHGRAGRLGHAARWQVEGGSSSRGRVRRRTRRGPVNELRRDIELHRANPKRRFFAFEANVATMRPQVSARVRWSRRSARGIVSAVNTAVAHDGDVAGKHGHGAVLCRRDPPLGLQGRAMADVLGVAA